MTKKKIIIIGWSIFAALLFIPVAIWFYHYQVDLYYYHHINGVDPFQTMKDSIGVELPESAEIIHYYYNKENGFYAVKLKIEKENIPALEEKLLVFFEREYTDRLTKDKVPNYGSNIVWWKLDFNAIESAYFFWTDVHRPRGSCWNWDKCTSSGENWAFITCEDTEQYYLYISSNITADKYVPKKSRYELLDEE